VLPAQPEPTSTFSYVNFLLDVTRQAASTSPVAFGEDEGSQRSGVTLTLRLWPLLQQVKTTRIYYRGMLSSLHHMMLVMAKTRDVTRRYSDRLAHHVVTPNFSDLVPQDEQILIDEITRRAEQDLVSPEEAIARFGVKAGTEQDEVERIKGWLEFKNQLEAKKLEAQAARLEQNTEESSE
jgi:hypothetical protein